MKRFLVAAMIAVLGIQGGLAQAEHNVPCGANNCFAFDIFTTNGNWGVGGPNENDPNLNLILEVTNGIERASFTFHNLSDASLSDVAITDVYFDDGTLMAIDDVISGPGTFFEQMATPAELPGGNVLDPAFVTTLQFSADASPPPPSNGINAGEWVQIDFDLFEDATIDDVLAELRNGTLRVGIHIQSFSDGSSESAMNIPEPASMLLLALGGMGLLARRRR